MSDTNKPHELGKNEHVGDHDVVFDCPHCHKSLVVDRVAEGHPLPCPMCSKEVMVPVIHRVVGLSESPETQALLAKPVWEQEMISIDAASKEIQNQREEAGNSYKKIVSEANRIKLRIEKLDAKLKELNERRTKLKAEHPVT